MRAAKGAAGGSAGFRAAKGVDKDEMRTALLSLTSQIWNRMDLFFGHGLVMVFFFFWSFVWSFFFFGVHCLFFRLVRGTNFSKIQYIYVYFLAHDKSVAG
jgi:hypothetical protein